MSQNFNTNLSDLLDRSEMVSWLESIGESLYSTDRISSEIAFKLANQVSGNNLANWPYYDQIYRKYGFKLVPAILNDNELGIILYEWNTRNDVLTVIGTINNEGIGESTNPMLPRNVYRPPVPPSPPPTPSVTPSLSATPSLTPSLSATPSLTPSLSATPSVTPSLSATPSLTPSKTPSNTVTPSLSATPSVTPSLSALPINQLRPQGLSLLNSIDSGGTITNINQNTYEYSGSVSTPNSSHYVYTWLDIDNSYLFDTSTMLGGGVTMNSSCWIYNNRTAIDYTGVSFKPAFSDSTQAISGWYRNSWVDGDGNGSVNGLNSNLHVSASSLLFYYGNGTNATPTNNAWNTNTKTETVSANTIPPTKWTSTGHGNIVMITPWHGITATHNTMPVSSTVFFYDSNGTQTERTIASSTQIGPFANGSVTADNTYYTQASDLYAQGSYTPVSQTWWDISVVKLNSPVGSGIKKYTLGVIDDYDMAVNQFPIFVNVGVGYGAGPTPAPPSYPWGPASWPANWINGDYGIHCLGNGRMYSFASAGQNNPRQLSQNIETDVGTWGPNNDPLYTYNGKLNQIDSGQPAKMLTVPYPYSGDSGGMLSAYYNNDLLCLGLVYTAQYATAYSAGTKIYTYVRQMIEKAVTDLGDEGESVNYTNLT